MKTTIRVPPSGPFRTIAEAFDSFTEGPQPLSDGVPATVAGASLSVRAGQTLIVDAYATFATAAAGDYAGGLLVNGGGAPVRDSQCAVSNAEAAGRSLAMPGIVIEIAADDPAYLVDLVAEASGADGTLRDWSLTVQQLG